MTTAPPQGPPTRVVFDTTVLIGAVYFNGVMRRALMSTTRPNVQLYTSYRILSEFYWTCANDPRFRTRRQHYKTLWTMLRAKTVAPAGIPPTCPDPNDDHVLGAAVTAKADMIVSTDHHLLNMKEFRGIPIVTPAEYLKSLVRPERSVG